MIPQLTISKKDFEPSYRLIDNTYEDVSTGYAKRFVVRMTLPNNFPLIATGEVLEEVKRNCKFAVQDCLADDRYATVSIIVYKGHEGPSIRVPDCEAVFAPYGDWGKAFDKAKPETYQFKMTSGEAFKFD